MAFREQVKFQRKAFPWTAAQSVETQKQSFGPVPISSSGGHVTWRVEGYVSLHGNQVPNVVIKFGLLGARGLFVAVRVVLYLRCE
mmetsp:Transcript_49274/g.132293  ORF Transcript_49274/g.132293 Transcript_49274/m.132293 type:complete len:85 (-) Transcript_49274:270-524(-)